MIWLYGHLRLWILQYWCEAKGILFQMGTVNVECGRLGGL